MIPSAVKNARTVASFKLSFKNQELGFYHIVEDRRLESRWRCGEQREEDTS
jgi:hypothetical protein